MKKFEIVVNDYLLIWDKWMRAKTDEEYAKAGKEVVFNQKVLDKHYHITFDEMNILKALYGYAKRLKKPLYWAIEEFYRLTNRDMTSIHQNFVARERKASFLQSSFNDHYIRHLNSVDRVDKVDCDGIDVSEEYADDYMEGVEGSEKWEKLSGSK